MVGRKRSVNLFQWGSLLREGSNTGRKGCWGEPCQWGSHVGGGATEGGGIYLNQEKGCVNINGKGCRDTTWWGAKEGGDQKG